MVINQFVLCDNQFEKPELCCVWMTVYLPPGGESRMSPCSCSYTWEVEWDFESPPQAVQVYVHRARTNWLVLNLCPAPWPPGCEWSSCGAFGLWHKMEPLTHTRSHLQMWRLGFEASCHRAKIEIGIGSRHEIGSGDLPSETHTEHVTYRAL